MNSQISVVGFKLALSFAISVFTLNYTTNETKTAFHTQLYSIGYASIEYSDLYNVFQSLSEAILARVQSYKNLERRALIVCYKCFYSISLPVDTLHHSAQVLQSGCNYRYGKQVEPATTKNKKGCGQTKLTEGMKPFSPEKVEAGWQQSQKVVSSTFCTPSPYAHSDRFFLGRGSNSHPA